MEVTDQWGVYGDDGRGVPLLEPGDGGDGHRRRLVLIRLDSGS